MTTLTAKPTIPAGMTEVTKDEFFARLYADKRDIMPKLNLPDSTDWETKNRERWGWSFPGWSNTYDNGRKNPEVYAVKL